MIDYSNFKTSLTLLKEQNDRLNLLNNDQEEWFIDVMKESNIQRFETCWDCLWKVLRRYLKEEIGLSKVLNGPKPILRLANENEILPSSIDTWLKYADARNATSHDYSAKKANYALKIIDSFVDDAISLYQTLSNESWEE